MKFLSFKFNILLLSLVTLFFLTRAISSLWIYYRLDALASVDSIQWKVYKKSNAFAIKGLYCFTIDKTYKGKTTLSKPYHLNYFSAEKQVKDNSAKTWKVWYCSKNPSISSLERSFPLKKSFYALMVLGIFFYFVTLSRSRYRKNL